MDWKDKAIKLQHWAITTKNRWQAWSDDHAKTIRLGITGCLVLIMAGLFIGAKILPGPSNYASSPVNQPQNLGNNSSTTVTLTSRSYNPAKQFMVAKFKVESGNGSQFIDPKNIHVRVKTLNADKVTYQLVPLVNDRFIVILDGLPRNFRAVQLKVINSQTDVTQLGSSDDSSGTSQDPASGSGKNSYAFIINQDKKINDRSLKKLSQKEYVVADLKAAIKRQKTKQTTLKQNIAAYKKQAAADQVAIDQAKNQLKYSVDKDATSSQISDAQSDYGTQQQNIKEAKREIKQAIEQVKLYQKQIDDIQSGHYQLPGKVKTGQLK